MIAKLIDMDNNVRVWSLVLLIIISFFSVIFYLPVWMIFTPLVFLGILIYTNVKYAEKYSNKVEKSLDAALIKNDFVADASYLADDYLSGIAINETESKIAILIRNTTKENFKVKQFDFKDIVECSIVEDGETLTKVSKGGLIGSSIIGGALVGGIGAVVGGMSADKYSSEQIVKATLTIVVDDLTSPIWNIDFLNSNMLVERNGELYRSIHSDMQKWYKRISIILKRNEKLNMKSI